MNVYPLFVKSVLVYISQSGNLILYRVTGLKVDPTNIAIPTSLIIEDEEGQLQFTTYIQLTDGFLSKKQLELALLVSLLSMNAAFI